MEVLGGREPVALPRKWSLVSPEHLLKVPLQRAVMEEGMMRLVRAVQPSKVLFPMEVREAGKVKFSRAVQY